MIIINQGETLKIEREITNLENLLTGVAYLAVTDSAGITDIIDCTIAGLVVSAELEPFETQVTGNFKLEIKLFLNGEADTIMLDYLTINPSDIPAIPGE